MLLKYQEELTRPLQEAMDFMRRMEAQLNTLTNGAVHVFPSGNKDHLHDNTHKSITSVKTNVVSYTYGINNMYETIKGTKPIKYLVRSNHSKYILNKPAMDR